ncbi:hypothetical protein ACYPKM_04775 [Pseudomonas aeruginosa]
MRKLFEKAVAFGEKAIPDEKSPWWKRKAYNYAVDAAKGKIGALIKFAIMRYFAPAFWVYWLVSTFGMFLIRPITSLLWKRVKPAVSGPKSTFEEGDKLAQFKQGSQTDATT